MRPTQHVHGHELPVLFGPSLLETLLIIGLVLGGVALALRPFIEADEDRSAIKVGTLGAACAGTALLLTNGPLEGMPSGSLAALAVAALALPFIAARGDRPRLRWLLSPAAPVVIAICAVSAVTATSSGALFAGVIAIAWAMTVRRKPRTSGPSNDDPAQVDHPMPGTAPTAPGSERQSSVRSSSGANPGPHPEAPTIPTSPPRNQSIPPSPTD